MANGIDEAVNALSEFCIDRDATAFVKLISNIPDIYQPTVNTVIKGLLLAMAEGDCTVLEQIPEFKDQLHPVPLNP